MQFTIIHVTRALVWYLDNDRVVYDKYTRSRHLLLNYKLVLTSKFYCLEAIFPFILAVLPVDIKLDSIGSESENVSNNSVGPKLLPPFYPVN